MAIYNRFRLYALRRKVIMTIVVPLWSEQRMNNNDNEKAGRNATFR
jgi:hypothetical protein